MATQYKGIPEGASAIIPRLYCHEVEAEIEFCCEALGAARASAGPARMGGHNMQCYCSAPRCS
jgi:hypothetical protein